MLGTSRSLKNQFPNSTALSRGHAASHGNTDHVEDLSRGNSCYILAKNLTMFHSYPQDVSEVGVKSNGQINLAGKIPVRFTDRETKRWGKCSFTR